MRYREMNPTLARNRDISVGGLSGKRRDDKRIASGNRQTRDLLRPEMPVLPCEGNGGNVSGDRAGMACYRCGETNAGYHMGCDRRFAGRFGEKLRFSRTT
jgi:hypothetical protein